MSQSDKSGSGLSDSGEGSSERTKNTNNSDKNSPSTPKTKRIKLNKTVESPLTIAADGLGDSCGLFFGRSAILSTTHNLDQIRVMIDSAEYNIKALQNIREQIEQKITQITKQQTTNSKNASTIGFEMPTVTKKLITTIDFPIVNAADLLCTSIGSFSATTGSLSMAYNLKKLQRALTVADVCIEILKDSRGRLQSRVAELELAAINQSEK